ncbi:MAG TPA: hypothetical protein VGN52_10055 [Burkholderiales bacterium]|jgi:hypothetical protein
MIRLVFAACLLLQLAACSTVDSVGKSIDTYFDRGWKIREQNTDFVSIEYDTEKFGDADILKKADGTCNAYSKTAIINRSNLDPITARRVSVYRCLTQNERRAREEAEKNGQPLPLRRD